MIYVYKKRKTGPKNRSPTWKNSVLVTGRGFWLVFFVSGTMGLGLFAMTKTKTDEDFADCPLSSYGPWLLVLALASTVASGSTFMGIPGMAYSKGFPAPVVPGHLSYRHLHRPDLVGSV